MEVLVEAIKNFDEEKAIYNIQNNYDNAANNINYQFNPIDKIVQLYDEKIALCEKMHAILIDAPTYNRSGSGAYLKLRAIFGNLAMVTD